MTWLLCLVGLHRWRVYGVDYRRACALSNMHPLAGCVALCARCGRVWDDTGDAVPARVDAYRTGGTPS